MIRWLLILLGGLLMLDTALISTLSNGHLGVWLPGLLGAPLLLSGLFYPALCRWSAAGAGRAVISACVGLYALIALFFLIMGALLLSAGSKPMRKGDVLIVLGCAVRGDRISLTLQRRLDTALDYLEKYPEVPVIVSGGKGDGENLPEAEAMRKYLLEHGVAPGRIHMEAASTSTYDNFRFSFPIMEGELGLPPAEAKVVFVTTRFHVLRSEATARKLGVEAYGIGAPGVWYITPNDYLRESLVIPLYLLMGRI